MSRFCFAGETKTVSLAAFTQTKQVHVLTISYIILYRTYSFFTNTDSAFLNLDLHNCHGWECIAGRQKEELEGIVDLQIDNRFRVFDSKWYGLDKTECLSLSVLVIYVCLKRGKNLTLKTCSPDFSALWMTKLYAKIKGVRAVSLFDFLKTWQVCRSVRSVACKNDNSAHIHFLIISPYPYLDSFHQHNCNR